MRKIMAFIMALVVGCGFASAQQAGGLPGVWAYGTADATAAFRIKYNGSAATATISNTVDSIIVVDDTVTTTIPTPAASTASTIEGLIEACTNVAGAKNYEVELWGMISTDIVSNRIVAATAVSLADGKWHTDVLKIDTSTALEYDAVSYADNISERWLSKIYGDPAGTGDVGIKVYIDQGSGYTLAYGKTITSPIYVLAAASGTLTNNPTAADAVVSVNEAFSDNAVYGLRVPQKAKCLVRATRATTATTGGIGAMFTAK